jgi:hypothetical protein
MDDFRTAMDAIVSDREVLQLSANILVAGAMLHASIKTRQVFFVWLGFAWMSFGFGHAIEKFGLESADQMKFSLINSFLSTGLALRGTILAGDSDQSQPLTAAFYAACAAIGVGVLAGIGPSLAVYQLLDVVTGFGMVAMLTAVFALRNAKSEPALSVAIGLAGTFFAGLQLPFWSTDALPHFSEILTGAAVVLGSLIVATELLSNGARTFPLATLRARFSAVQQAGILAIHAHKHR